MGISVTDGARPLPAPKLASVAGVEIEIGRDGQFDLEGRLPAQLGAGQLGGVAPELIGESSVERLAEVGPSSGLVEVAVYVFIGKVEVTQRLTCQWHGSS